MPAPRLDCPGAPSATGAYQIAWSGAETGPFVLTENGAAIYEGTDFATTVSGRRTGTYDYRLTVGGETAACSVQVAPPSMTLTAVLFLFGFVISAATVVLVVRGHLAHRRGAIG